MSEVKPLYIPITVDGKIVGCLPQPDFFSRVYSYIFAKPKKNVNLLGSKYDFDTKLPYELISANAKQIEKISGFSKAKLVRTDGEFDIYETVFGTMGVKRDFAPDECSDDPDGQLVPMVELNAVQERFIPSMPLTAYRAMLVGMNGGKIGDCP